jgi:hypothetical protein
MARGGTISLVTVTKVGWTRCGFTQSFHFDQALRKSVPSVDRQQIDLHVVGPIAASADEEVSIGRFTVATPLSRWRFR